MDQHDQHAVQGQLPLPRYGGDHHVDRCKDGLPETVKYQDLPVLPLNKLQRQQRQIKALKVRNHQLELLQTQVGWLIRQPRGR